MIKKTDTGYRAILESVSRLKPITCDCSTYEEAVAWMLDRQTRRLTELWRAVKVLTTVVHHDDFHCDLENYCLTEDDLRDMVIDIHTATCEVEQDAQRLLREPEGQIARWAKRDCERARLHKLAMLADSDTHPGVARKIAEEMGGDQ